MPLELRFRERPDLNQLKCAHRPPLTRFLARSNPKAKYEKGAKIADGQNTRPVHSAANSRTLFPQQQRRQHPHAGGRTGNQGKANILN